MHTSSIMQKVPAEVSGLQAAETSGCRDFRLPGLQAADKVSLDILPCVFRLVALSLSSQKCGNAQLLMQGFSMPCVRTKLSAITPMGLRPASKECVV